MATTTAHPRGTMEEHVTIITVKAPECREEHVTILEEHAHHRGARDHT